MDFVSIIEYGALIFLIVWLVWLASRPFLVNLNRLLFVLCGFVIHGFFANSFVIPLAGSQAAYMEARRKIANMEKLPSPSGMFPLDEPTILFIVYVAVPLALFSLLMLWLQRVLARCPRRNSV